jgi:hypothetical protein
MNIFARFFAPKFLDIPVLELKPEHLRSLLKSQRRFTDGEPVKIRGRGWTKEGWVVFHVVNSVEGDRMHDQFMVHPRTREILCDWAYQDRTGDRSFYWYGS